MADTLRIKDVLGNFRLNWGYNRKADSATAEFTTDTSNPLGDTHEIHVLPHSVKGRYQVVLEGSVLSNRFSSIYEAKQAVEQELAEDYPNFGPPNMDVLGHL
ncbi:MAG: hypothetical protein OXU67_00230 [Chloroflexota bacterium]|nr:hypothetical protein [Chloroflexota bacterium]